MPKWIEDNKFEFLEGGAVSTEETKKILKMMIMDHLGNPNHEGVVAEIQQFFPPQYHTSVVTEILNVAVDK